MGYVEEMRKYVGHKPIFICGCGVLIYNDKGEVLLQKRSDDNSWGNPGGSMEFGETIYETAIRETYEETGLILKEEDLKLFKIYSGYDLHHFYPNGDEVYIVSIMFETNKYSGKLTKDSESLDLKFFHPLELPLNTSKLFTFMVPDIKKKYLEKENKLC